MRRIISKNIIILVIIILILSSCIRLKELVASNTNSPNITDRRYMASSQVSSGGDELTQQNLADIKIENLEDDRVKMTLSFMTSSGISLIDQKVSKGVPNYTISHIDGVDRMVIKLDGISNWTYRIYENEIKDNKVISGVLKQEPTGSDSLYLYISTLDEYGYTVEKNANKLEIYFTHIPTALSYSYYIRINAFVEYQNAYFSYQDFYPSISLDGVNGVLISKPFSTESQANEYLLEQKDTLTNMAQGKEISIIRLGNNELPEYNYQNEIEQIINNPIGTKYGEPILGIPLVTDGRFLSWGNSKTEFAYAKTYTILGAQEGDVYSYEQICTSTGEGQRNLIEYQCTSLLSAGYSYDGQYMAFIDQDAQTRMLVIVDTKTGKLYIPADDGFGIDTSSFVWSNNDNRLYAITGEYDSKQLLCYDMQDINNIQVFALVEEEYIESNLYLHDDNIYYLKSTPDNSTTNIYSADINTGKSREHISANSFMLSPDGQSLVVNDMQKDDVENYSLYIYDIDSGEKQSIQDGKMVMDYTWSKDSTRVYYSVYKSAGWEEEYPLELYYYDVEQKTSYYMMDMITGALYTAYEKMQVLVMSIFELQDRQVSVTYIVK